MKRLPIPGALLCAIAILPLLFAQADKAEPAAGKKVFEARCSDCHNADSKEEKVGPGLKGVKDGTLPSGRKSTHDNILGFVEQKTAYEMPAFGDLLSEKEKEDVIAYVLTL